MAGIHGGDIYTNKVQLDFSVNINPLGIPKEVQQALFDENAEKAEEIYLEAEKCSNELQNDFAAILNISAGLSQNGQSVFA